MAERFKTVLVGCGLISRTWLQAIKQIPEIILVGLVDLNDAQARVRAEEFNLSLPTGTDLQQMLRATAPDIVFDCTIPEAHYSVTRAALDFGCHVLGEKPISDELDKARAMVVAAGHAGKIYAVIQNRRYDRNIRRLKHFLQTGAIGRITSINSDFFIGAHFGGFREQMRHVLLKDMAIHTFDAARFLTGADPLAVYCHESNPVGSWYAHGASAVAIFEMSEGIVFNYRGSWVAEGFRTSWESEWRIIGDKGSVIWNGAERLECQVGEDSSGFLSTYHQVEIPDDALGPQFEGHAGVIQNFVGALQTGRTPETICTDNIKSLAMVFGAVDSATSNQRLEIIL